MITRGVCIFLAQPCNLHYLFEHDKRHSWSCWLLIVSMMLGWMWTWTGHEQNYHALYCSCFLSLIVGMGKLPTVYDIINCEVYIHHCDLYVDTIVGNGQWWNIISCKSYLTHGEGATTPRSDHNDCMEDAFLHQLNTSLPRRGAHVNVMFTIHYPG